MAINGCEIKLIEYLLTSVRAGLSRLPRVLFLGYPDILATERTFDSLHLPVPWPTVEKRKESKDVWPAHGRQLGTYPMCESKSLIASFGATCTVLDAIHWGREDVIADLNLPLTSESCSRLGQFDLIVDPGTIEHCFNIAQAFASIDQLLGENGFIYHQSAVAFPNHGFWSISPTAFFDYYEQLGYELGVPYVWRGTHDPDGFEPIFLKVDPFAPFPTMTTPVVGSFVFRKRSSPRAGMRSAGYPIQRIYSNNRRDPALSDFAGAALPSSHRCDEAF